MSLDPYQPAEPSQSDLHVHNTHPGQTDTRSIQAVTRGKRASRRQESVETPATSGSLSYTVRKRYCNQSEQSMWYRILIAIEIRDCYMYENEQR
jgi:hypothetical protein